MVNVVRSVKPRAVHAPAAAPSHDRRELLLAWAAASRRYGSPAHTLEEAADALSVDLGLQMRFFVMPTSIMAVDDVEGRTFLLSVAAGAAQVERLVGADTLMRRVAAGTLPAASALALLGNLDRRSELYSGWTLWLAGAASSGAAAAALGGGLPEVVASTAVGSLSASLIPLLARRRETVRLTEVVAGFAAALATASLPQPFARDLVVLAGLIWFMPGYSLTTAFADLATGHLLSGATGLVAAGTTLLLLALGVGLGSQIAGFLPVFETVAAVPLPVTTLPLTVAVASLSFAILLQVRMRWLPWVAASCAVAVLGDMAGDVVFGPALGGAVGALAVALIGAVGARTIGLPLAVTQVPGLLVLVPGSIGFRAVQALARQDVLGGIEAATHTVLAAIALVGGSLLGAALLPSRVERTAPRAHRPVVG